MTTKLKNLKITEGSLVDKGANEDAEVVLFKREEPVEDTKKQTVLDKLGRKISGGRMKVLKELMAAFEDVTQKLGTMFADIEGTQKGANMPITEEVLNDLPDEAKQHIDDLEKAKTESETKFSDKETELADSVTKVEELTAKVSELEKDEPEDEVLKGASKEVIAKMDELKKEVAEAKEIAKAEKEARITKEFNDKAKELPHVVGDVSKMLRSAYDVSDENGKALEETFKATNEQIEKGSLFDEIGSPGTGDGGDAESKIDAGGIAIAKSENISKEQGIAKFMETDDGKALYAQSQRVVN